jgi:Protein of unknown function (DUF2283)
MVLFLNELINHLKPVGSPSDHARPSDALWIRFSKNKTHETIEYRTADENQIVHIYLDDKGALVGIEIFP